jgi:hypothetical protein
VRPAARRPPPPRAFRLVIDRRVSVCIVQGDYSIAAMDTWLLVGQNDKALDQMKIDAIAWQIRSTGKVPGTFGLGTFGGKTYLLDGRHRREAVRQSGRGTVHAVIAWVVCKLE